MKIVITIEYIGKMVKISHNLSKSLEFELKNVTVLYDKTLLLIVVSLDLHG